MGIVYALAAVGQLRVAGHLDVAQEHFISAGVMRRLAASFDAAGHARGGRHVIIGLAPGAIHEIATLAFATMLRRAGLRVTYLGPDLPVPSWVQAVGTTHPDAVVIGAPRTADTRAASDSINGPAPRPLLPTASMAPTTPSPAGSSQHLVDVTLVFFEELDELA